MNDKIVNEAIFLRLSCTVEEIYIDTDWHHLPYWKKLLY